MNFSLISSFIIMLISYLIYYISPLDIFRNEIFYNTAIFFYSIYFLIILRKVVLTPHKDINEHKNSLSEILISIPTYWVLFAFCFRGIGINDINALNAAEVNSAYTYFSIVTFTTLGYGEFTPDNTTRFYAAFEAVIGFLFVPLIISQFLSVNNEKNRMESDPSLQNVNLTAAVQAALNDLHKGRKTE